MVKVFGQKIHGDRLKRLRSDRLRANVADAVLAGAILIVNDAADSIRQGAVSGADHVASKPGEPPNADTHRLDQSGVATVNRNTLRGEASFTAEHAIPLEFGTAYVAERPFLKPAGQRQRPAARRLVAEAVNKTSRGG